MLFGAAIRKFTKLYIKYSSGTEQMNPAGLQFTLMTQGTLRICIHLLIVNYDSWVVHWFSCPLSSLIGLATVNG